MKIAILTPTFSHYSGIDRVVQEQAEGLVKKGHEVVVVALEAGIKPKNYKVVEIGIPENAFLQRLYRLFFFLDFKKMAYYKKLRGYDKVISHFYPMNLLASKAKKKSGVKYVYHNHGINTLADGFFQKVYMRLFLFFTNLSLKNVDEVYSVSDFLRKELKRQTGMDSKVVYNKVDKKKFHKKVKGDKIIKKYGLKGKKVLLYVGRIAPHKGIHDLIRIFKEVKKEIPNARLVIVGKPTFSSYYKKLQNLADRGVIFTGIVKDDELPQYYAACDVYVTASQWEGFNLPAAEAQVCGKPVVAFDTGSHREVVENGILIKKGDLKGFSESIVRLLVLGKN